MGSGNLDKVEGVKKENLKSCGRPFVFQLDKDQINILLPDDQSPSHKIIKSGEAWEIY